MMKNFPPEALEKMRAQIPKVSMYSNFDMLWVTEDFTTSDNSPYLKMIFARDVREWDTLESWEIIEDEAVLEINIFDIKLAKDMNIDIKK
jgi:hypothetical protein